MDSLLIPSGKAASKALPSRQRRCRVAETKGAFVLTEYYFGDGKVSTEGRSPAWGASVPSCLDGEPWWCGCLLCGPYQGPYAQLG